MSSHNNRDKEKSKDQRISAERISERLSAIAAEESESAPVSHSEDSRPDSVADQIQQLAVEKQELMNTLVRRQADFENFRKRVEKDRQQDRNRGVEAVIEQILPVLDAFDLALAGRRDDSETAEYRKGFELIRRQLWDTLSKQGVARIDSVGKEFNPHIHHAIGNVVTDEHEEGTVLEELQPGYMFLDRVLRPAMVRVSSAPENKSTRTSIS